MNQDAPQTPAVSPPDSYVLPHEIPNIETLLQATLNPQMEIRAGERPEPHTTFNIGPVPVPINPLFSIFYAIIAVVIIRKALRRASVRHPGKLQVAVEMLLGGLRNFFKGVMGPQGERYLPYIGSLWIFIWFNNIMVLIPGLKSPSSSFKTTVALGLCTFVYVHYSAIRAGGLWGWFRHLLGEPLWLAPLNFPLHIISELIKPVSLSLRLYGNIFGEDKLLAVMLGLGMLIVAGLAGTPFPMVGVPLQLPFFFLVVLLSTIQATVFALLAAIYIVLLLPHEHEEHAAEDAPKQTPEAESH